MRRDFGKFNIEHKPPSKYKLTAVSDEFGHADVGVAMAICLPKAVAMLEGRVGLGKDDVLVEENDEELSEEEVAEMPDDLKDIYEMDLEDAALRGKRPKISEFSDGW